MNSLVMMNNSKDETNEDEWVTLLMSKKSEDDMNFINGFYLMNCLNDDLMDNK